MRNYNCSLVIHTYWMSKAHQIIRLRAGWIEMKKSKAGSLFYYTCNPTEDHMTDKGCTRDAWRDTNICFNAFFFLEWNFLLLFRKTSDLFRFIKWYLQMLVGNFGQKQQRMYRDSELKLHYDISEILQRWPNSVTMPHADHGTRVSGTLCAQRKSLWWSGQTCFFDYEFTLLAFQYFQN